MGKLLIKLPNDRTKVGTISLISNTGTTITTLSALGKAANNTAAAHGNPGASPLLKFGNTPNGTYQILNVVNAGPGTNYPDTHKYGNTKVIILDPSGGEALLAKQNGRTGLLIHGGAPGENGNLLRRTNGCVRMMNEEIQELANKIFDLKIQNGEDTKEVTVEEEEPTDLTFSDTDDNVNEGDPPPLP